MDLRGGRRPLVLRVRPIGGRRLREAGAGDDLGMIHEAPADGAALGNVREAASRPSRRTAADASRPASERRRKFRDAPEARRGAQKTNRIPKALGSRAGRRMSSNERRCRRSAAGADPCVGDGRWSGVSGSFASSNALASNECAIASRCDGTTGLFFFSIAALPAQPCRGGCAAPRALNRCRGSAGCGLFFANSFWPHTPIRLEVHRPERRPKGASRPVRQSWIGVNPTGRARSDFLGLPALLPIPSRDAGTPL